MAEARTAFASKDFVNAAAAFERLLQRATEREYGATDQITDEQRAAWTSNRATCLRAQDLFDESELAYVAAIRLDSRQPARYTRLAGLYGAMVRAGRPECIFDALKARCEAAGLSVGTPVADSMRRKMQQTQIKCSTIVKAKVELFDAAMQNMTRGQYPQAVLQLRQAAAVLTRSDFPIGAKVKEQLAVALDRAKHESGSDIVKVAVLRHVTERDTYPNLNLYEWGVTMELLVDVYGTRVMAVRGSVDELIGFLQTTLSIFTRQAHPLKWAALSLHLGNAYAACTTDRPSSIGKSIKHFKDALCVFTMTTCPQLFACTQVQLANTYANRVEGQKSIDIELSIECCNAARNVFTAAKCPTEWANMNFTLGNAYFQRVAGEGRENIEMSIKCLEAALSVVTIEGMPEYWARSKSLLGSAFTARIEGKRRDNIEVAITYFMDAIRVYTFPCYPAEWARAQTQLAAAYQARIVGEEEDNFKTAVSILTGVSDVLPVEMYPIDWATATATLATAYLHPAMGEEGANIDESIRLYKAALANCDRRINPILWAKCTVNLGNAYLKCASGDKMTNIAKSVTFYTSALTVLTKEAHPADFVYCASQLGVALLTPQSGVEIKSKAAQSSVEQALEAALQALDVYKQQRYIIHRGSGNFGGKAAIRESARMAISVGVRCYVMLHQTSKALELADAGHAQGLTEMARSLSADQPTSGSDPGLDPNPQLPPLSYAAMQSVLGANTVAAVWYMTDGYAGVFLVAKGLSSPSHWTYSSEQYGTIQRALYQFTTMQKESSAEARFQAELDNLSSALCMADIYDNLLRQNDLSDSKDANHAHPDITRAASGNAYQAPNYSHLVIMAHGLLQWIPFAALPVRKDGPCLSDVYSGGTMFSPNMSLFRIAVCRTPGPLRLTAGGMVAVQNPTQDLPAADQEVRHIVQQLVNDDPGGGSPFVLAHGRADKASIVAALQERSEREDDSFALHISCHGIYDPARRWENCLQLAGNTGLTVGELMGLPLLQCHLAVLSGCFTGRTDAVGSFEAMGLTSALLVAGVPRIVSSLWAVSDAAAALMIARLYYYLISERGHLGLAACLCKAQIYLRQLPYAEAVAALTGIDPALADRFRATRGARTPPRPQEVVVNPTAKLHNGWSAEQLAQFVCLLAEGTGDTSYEVGETRAVNSHRFQQEDWNEFCEAFDAKRATFIYSHLFPAPSKHDKHVMMPERDYW